jgi:hypothetical protein
MANAEKGWRLAVAGLALAAGAAACSSSSTEAPPPPLSSAASSPDTINFPPGIVICNPNVITKGQRLNSVVFTCPDSVRVDTTPDPGLNEASITVFNGLRSASEGTVGWNAGMPVSFPVPGSQRERVFVSTAGGGIVVGLSSGRPTTANAEGLRQNRQPSKPL